MNEVGKFLRIHVRIAANGAPRPMKMGNIVSPWRYEDIQTCE